jgi:formate dehydrogenase maturation protein FdhE
MNKLETTEAVEILLSEKKKAGYKLAKAYDSYCLFPNEHDQEDWDNYSALAAALEMAVEALEKQIPKKPKMPLDAYWVCPTCGSKVEHPFEHCRRCGQAIDWTEDE